MSSTIEPTHVPPPFLAFASKPDDIATLKSFVVSKGWSEDLVHSGNIRTATEYLSEQPSPTLLLVELPSVDEASSLLDALANVCDANTKVITIGDINEYSFYCWLMDLGLFSYLLCPLTLPVLEACFQKSLAPSDRGAKPEKPPAKIFAVMGSRGGVGATMVAVNLAGIIAEVGKKKVALYDVDPQEGSVAMALDMEPCRGLREVLERPDRIDSLFIERVMTKFTPNLSVLSSEESLNERIAVTEEAAEALLNEMREKFEVIIIDMPRHMNAFDRACLKYVDKLVLVSELTLLGLRDAMRMADMLRDSLKITPPLLVANRVGLLPKHEMPVYDFEKAISMSVSCNIPSEPDVFMDMSSEIAALKHRRHLSVQPLMRLASMLVPGVKLVEAEPKQKSFSLFVKKAKVVKGST